MLNHSNLQVPFGRLRLRGRSEVDFFALAQPMQSEKLYWAPASTQ
jgi:hypothetical protein